eukprot:364570-Chlamydomonas_euryale.AAC.22
MEAHEAADAACLHLALARRLAQVHGRMYTCVRPKRHLHQAPLRDGAQCAAAVWRFDAWRKERGWATRVHKRVAARQLRADNTRGAQQRQLGRRRPGRARRAACAQLAERAGERKADVAGVVVLKEHAMTGAARELGACARGIDRRVARAERAIDNNAAVKYNAGVVEACKDPWRHPLRATPHDQVNRLRRRRGVEAGDGPTARRAVIIRLPQRSERCNSRLWQPRLGIRARQGRRSAQQRDKRVGVPARRDKVRLGGLATLQHRQRVVRRQAVAVHHDVAHAHAVLEREVSAAKERRKGA